ncbi:hypothetical protein LCGC14_0664250 [marine sediment metagenome]|uniref:Uncharacterized protein n=1 Tax=marine sediment metagenome TaxID=412755 RepID=A0A0F9QXV8_9ZZZZ
MTLEDFLHQRYMYGGEVWKLGDIIIDLQNNLPNQRAVDMYLIGLLHNQKPIT